MYNQDIILVEDFFDDLYATIFSGVLANESSVNIQRILSKLSTLKGTSIQKYLERKREKSESAIREIGRIVSDAGVNHEELTDTLLARIEPYISGMRSAVKSNDINQAKNTLNRMRNRVSRGLVGGVFDEFKTWLTTPISTPIKSIGAYVFVLTLHVISKTYFLWLLKNTAYEYLVPYILALILYPFTTEVIRARMVKQKRGVAFTSFIAITEIAIAGLSMLLYGIPLISAILLRVPSIVMHFTNLGIQIKSEGRDSLSFGLVLSILVHSLFNLCKIVRETA
jgi:hypothetical protein